MITDVLIFPLIVIVSYLVIRQHHDFKFLEKTILKMGFGKFLTKNAYKPKLHEQIGVCCIEEICNEIDDFKKLYTVLAPLINKSTMSKKQKEETIQALYEICEDDKY